MLLLALHGTAGLAAQEEAPPVVEVTAVDYAFVAPESIPSGWVTFRFENRGEELHVFDLLGFPSGKTYEDLRRQHLRPADSISSAFLAGEIGVDSMVAGRRRVEPEWVDEMTVGNGVGLTSPGITAQTTVKLEPGHYYMKCFVVTARSEAFERPMLHWEVGMRRPLVVTETMESRRPPPADVEIMVSHYTIEMADTVPAGRRTFALHFGKRSAAGESPYQDLHLVRLTGSTTLDEVAKWTAGAFRDPAPVPLLGGAHAAPAGRTAYVTADLEPDRYAWISDATAEKGMAKTFIVE